MFLSLLDLAKDARLGTDVERPTKPVAIVGRRQQLTSNVLHRGVDDPADERVEVGVSGKALTEFGVDFVSKADRLEIG